MVNPPDMTAHWTRLLRLAEEEVRDTFAQLPAPLRARADGLPCLYEDRPGPELRQEGIPHDTLGLFLGEEWVEAATTMHPVPTQIILFLENLWEFSDRDEELYREEVRITYLHELGHYLGLDELDLDDRDLS
jgi:predicted Zn-dependent protease with MMP-like domain